MPGVAVLPVAVAVLLFLWWLWLGRDPRPGTIVPTWRPPSELPPGPAGTLIDQRADPGDILATILDLARRGYLRIIESHPAGVPAKGDRDVAIARVLLEKTDVWETEWRFVRTDKPMNDTLAFEAAVLFAIFGDQPEVSARDLRLTFPAHVPGIFASLYDHLLQRGYFLHSPDKARREWIGLASLVGGFALVAGVWSQRFELAVSLALCAALLFLFARWMPIPTRRGAKMRDRLLGLREYIRRAEKNELEFRHGPEKTPELFEEILPYAIALNVSDLWLREFQELLPESPPWYAREGLPATRASFSADLGVFLAVSLRLFTETS